MPQGDSARIIVDANVLWNPQAMAALAKETAPKILPVVAFAERARQYAVRGWSINGLWDLLAEADLEVEPLHPTAAVRYSMGVLDDRTWDRLARDALIAGHLEPDDVLWTANRDDFLELGVPRAQLVQV